MLSPLCIICIFLLTFAIQTGLFGDKSESFDCTFHSFHCSIQQWFIGCQQFLHMVLQNWIMFCSGMVCSAIICYDLSQVQLMSGKTTHLNLHQHLLVQRLKDSKIWEILIWFDIELWRMHSINQLKDTVYSPNMCWLWLNTNKTMVFLESLNIFLYVGQSI